MFTDAEMNLPSVSYVSRCGKPPRSWSNSGDKVPLHVARNCGYQQSNKNQSPEINNDDLASVYSDAGDTFASRPSNATYEDHQDAASVGLYNAQRCADSDSRDFILKRFLPAAQAMAASGAKSSTSSSSLPAENRPQKKSSPAPTARFGSFSSVSSKSKSRFIHEVKQDVRFEDFDDGSEDIKACGFPLHLGRLTLQHFRYGFWTSRSSGRSKSHDYITEKGSKKVIEEEATDNSNELFWSDEEGFDDAVSQVTSCPSGMTERGECSNSSELRKRLGVEILLAAPARLHSMETVHTPDHRGFLGLPKTSKLTSGEIERARQVDRLGARLSRMISKTNYMESRNVTRMNEHDERETGSSSHGPSATTSSSSVEAPRTKWVDAVASLMPPPSPKMPSESWLSNTLPPERFMEVKKLSRKSLGSFIPIKPPLKPTSTAPNREEISIRLHQSCSLKEHLQGRQVLRSATMQAV